MSSRCIHWYYDCRFDQKKEEDYDCRRGLFRKKKKEQIKRDKNKLLGQEWERLVWIEIQTKNMNMVWLIVWYLCYVESATLFFFPSEGDT